MINGPVVKGNESVMLSKLEIRARLQREKPRWREVVLSDDCPTLQAVAPGEALVGLHHRPSFDDNAPT
jgi:hypothetical protein